MKPIRVLIVRDRGCESRTIDQDLETLQSLVGGYIEAVNFGPGVVALLNEDGKMLGLPTNNRATRWAIARNIGLRPGDYIVGTMVIVGAVDADGDFTDVPDDVLELAGLSKGEQ